MGQILHGSAKTTHAIRGELQRSQASIAHLAEAEAELLRHAAAGRQFVLTGKASSIQSVIRALKAAGVGSARIKAKAYWAPGKTGLD